MKASKLIEILEKLSKEIRFDPDVRIELNDELKDIGYIGTRGASYDDPKQARPVTHSATAIFRVV